jgi:hypothetical protein
MLKLHEAADLLGNGADQRPPAPCPRTGLHSRLVVSSEAANKAVVVWLRRRTDACAAGDETAALVAEAGLAAALKTAAGAASDLLFLGD